MGTVLPAEAFRQYQASKIASNRVAKEYSPGEGVANVLSPLMTEDQR